MKKKAKPFQIVMTIVFVIILVAAVAVFSMADKSKKPKELQNVYGPVSVWGTLPHGVDQVVSAFNALHEGSISVSYVYVPPEKLDQVLLEALADGTNPDVLLLPHQWLHRNAPRIAPISYVVEQGGMSVREYKDTYAQGSEIFLFPEGVMAIPMGIDPLVMYWNRDLFTNAGISTVPKLWKEFLTITPKLTKKHDLDITQSAVGMGEFENVTSAKDILSLLFLQVGNPITGDSTTGGGLESAFVLDRKGISEALRFYTDFANPRKAIYTWNRSLPNSQDAFLANDLAVYFDFASAHRTLLAKNPRLNVDIAAVPQTDGQPIQTTFGDVHGLAVLKKARNLPGGFAFAKLFTGPTFAAQFAEVTGMTPMRRDLLAVPQTDPAKAVFYDAALRAKTWIDPHPDVSDTIFADMVDGITSGKLKLDEAVDQAARSMNAYIQSR